jgi:hypothetical protein
MPPKKAGEPKKASEPKETASVAAKGNKTATIEHCKS